MGVLYSVLPLDPELAAYLRTLKIAVPKKLPSSRLPTPAELVKVAESIPKTKSDLVHTAGALRQIHLSATRKPEAGWWTSLQVLENTGDDEACEFYFEKGWPALIIEFLIRLTVFTGPLVLIPDTGDDPLLIDPTVKVEAALA